MPAPKRPSKVKQLAASIREFGFTNPVLISPENDIIAGQGPRARGAAPFRAWMQCLRDR
jgi:ParB-like chromosome segregation protein Spo0J